MLKAISNTQNGNAQAAGTVSVLTYGAIGDGNSHPLSEFFATLAEAQVVYPLATSLTKEIDWAAAQKAVNTGTPNIYFPSTAPSTTPVGTSTTSVAIGTGSKTFTTQSGLGLVANQFMLIEPVSVNQSVPVPNTYMFGLVTSYSGTTLVMNITSVGGSGTYADWNIVVNGNTLGVYLINQYLNIPYIKGGREGYVRIYGDGSGAGNSRLGAGRYGTTILRNANQAGIKLLGTSWGAGEGNKLSKYFRMDSIQIAGGWAKYNTTADYPLIDLNSGYELIWNDVVVTDAISHLIFMREVMDSRFHDVRVTVGGGHNGYNRSLNMTNASTTATLSDTTGLFKGQKIFGTGISPTSSGVNVFIASVDSATQITLSTAANFTGTCTVVFEAKAAFHICSNDTGGGTSNNLVMTGFRFETCPSTSLRIDGNNIIDIFIDDFKGENVQYALDYIVDVTTASGVYIDNKAWLYGAATTYNLMEFPFTTAGTTLSSISSANLFSFTVPDMYFSGTGTLSNGSAIVTGLSSTSGLRVGMELISVGATTFFNQYYISTIDSATQVTLTSAATAAMAGSSTVVFGYKFDSGVFGTRMFYSGMSVIAYDPADARNYALCRVVSYTSTTGAITLHVRNVFGDTAKSISSWKLAACHPGLVRFSESSKICRGSFTGGYSGAQPVTTQAYINTFVHVDGINDLECEFDVTAGYQSLPKNSFQAQISTTASTIGTGAKTFTISTGLPADMFAAGKAVYITENTQSTAQNFMAGTVTSYTSGTGALVVNITKTQGSGSLSNWNIAFDMQSLYLKTGTNSDLLLTERSPTFGCPANYATSVYPIISDVRAASGSKVINNTVYYDTAALFATITPDANTIYYIVDTGKIYLGSTLLSPNLTIPNAWTGQQYFATATLTDGATINWNLNTQQSAKVTLAGNRTLANPTNMVNGATYTLIIAQDATGSRTLSYGANYKWASGTVPVLSTAANAVDIITFLSDGTNMYGSIQKGFA